MITQADVDNAFARWRSASKLAQLMSKYHPHADRIADFWQDEETALNEYEQTFNAFIEQEHANSVE